jgi:hypothetical protein
VKLGTLGDAHEVAVPRGLEVQAPEPDFEFGWEGVRASHGVPLGPVLGADHHRDGWWKVDLQRNPLPGAPTVERGGVLPEGAHSPRAWRSFV